LGAPCFSLLASARRVGSCFDSLYLRCRPTASLVVCCAQQSILFDGRPVLGTHARLDGASEGSTSRGGNECGACVRKCTSCDAVSSSPPRCHARGGVAGRPKPPRRQQRPWLEPACALAQLGKQQHACMPLCPGAPGTTRQTQSLPPSPKEPGVSRDFTLQC
jgi:hypothetical protein